MSTTTSTSAPEPPTSPTILLFARGVYSLFHLWPALRLAVTSQWGGEDSASKRIWFISTVVDEFEDKASPAQLASFVAPNAEGQTSGGLVPPPAGLDLDAVADLLFDIMLEEFEIELEDDSPVMISRRLLQLWSDASRGLEGEVVKLEEEERRMGKSKVVASAGVDEDGESDGESGSESGSDEEEGEGMEGVQEEAPALVPRQKEEPEVDDDGFTMVKGKGKKGGK